MYGGFALLPHSLLLKLNVLWGRNVIVNTYYTIMDKEEGLRG